MRRWEDRNPAGGAVKYFLKYCLRDQEM